MKIHLRTHEWGPSKPRVRIWTDEQQGYGQFNIATYDVAMSLVNAINTIGLPITVIQHRCTGDDCTCEPLTCGQSIVAD
jgi:hypothetical protein